MIPLKGTVTIRSYESDVDIGCPVIATSGEDYLVVRDGYRGPRWASELGQVRRFIPAPEVVPAQPGWWARYAWLDRDTDAVETALYPVIAWRIGGEEEEPVVLTSYAYTDRWDAIAFSGDPGPHLDEQLDAIVYDPDLRPEQPEVLEDEARQRAEREARRRARKAQEVAA